MHIEPGLISQAKIIFANVAIISVLGVYAPSLIKTPSFWLRSVLAALFFTLCMQAFHMQVGPSELHFLGAMPIYLAFGFVPTLFGFALGLLFQGMLFEPQDLVHLSVNTLSLAIPLIAVHYSMGRKLVGLTLRNILKLDAAYYAGVVTMVAFWLALAQTATSFAAWAQFALSYLPMVALEPAITLAVLWAIHKTRQNSFAQLCFARTA